MTRLFASLCFVLLVSGAAGCMGAKESWSAQPVTTAEARIVPQEVYRRKNRLFVRVTYTNLGRETVSIDRDAMQLQLQGGRVLGRSNGMTTQHHPYNLHPNEAHSIYVDFMDDDISERLDAANVLWKGAVFAGARELVIPPTPVQAR